ncbi:hypothetical protein HOLleu_22593 [Holothuria leucospilota]|uniref:Peptidase A2 domain-containing protein n=1 Tax=Holothuria leucospilota TaxID=206669 RepID=A0A9Q1BYZ7_HOLLE|nr:hypothetical protein HOLleu_22593 [Holothuria leucospilota]
MELDTGAAVTIISETTFRKNWPNERLEKSGVSLTTYTQQEVPVLGVFQPTVNYDDQCVVRLVFLVKGNGPDLFGRDPRKIRLD